MSKDDYARAIIEEGRRMGIAPRGIVIALATALVESDLVMYANSNDPESLNYPHEKLSYDANSCGLFQQRDPWWGTAADRMDPARSARMFYNELQKLDYNDTSCSPGWYAQEVQKSAYPGRYDQRMSEAQELYDRLAGTPTAREVPAGKPEYTEIDRMGNSRDMRSRPLTNFLLHTEEGDSSAEGLAGYLNNTNNGVSYHYTLRDGILVDVVDTDYASWSALNANAFTLNLCFAGSHAAWSRDEWMQRERDIEIASYIAVQDCHKYGIPLQVIKPPYVQASGITDHRYVTQCLGIGTHTDVGDGFPWDVFENYVNKWSGVSAPVVTGGEDMAWGEIIHNFNGQPVSREDMIKYMDARLERVERMVVALLDQVAGAGAGTAVAQGRPAKFEGFSEGGNRSLYDLASALGAERGIAGCKDVKSSTLVDAH
ncbi:N-acetylmuramoyl-L-alanine amidase [Nocardia vaccinii]|uniref:N-acetylmuramoyl-L-alanine amidase n=1 Tax=Nocardia vaccinii TaxID=1822 RepID=UPI000833DB5C|nr:N-acetylmuramoyl-L-alanine amidase [Nocardia vaccinii]